MGFFLGIINYLFSKGFEKGVQKIKETTFIKAYRKFLIENKNQFYNGKIFVQKIDNLEIIEDQNASISKFIQDRFDESNFEIFNRIFSSKDKLNSEFVLNNISSTLREKNFLNKKLIYNIGILSMNMKTHEIGRESHTLKYSLLESIKSNTLSLYTPKVLSINRNYKDETIKLLNNITGYRLYCKSFNDILDQFSLSELTIKSILHKLNNTKIVSENSEKLIQDIFSIYSFAFLSFKYIHKTEVIVDILFFDYVNCISDKITEFEGNDQMLDLTNIFNEELISNCVIDAYQNNPDKIDYIEHLYSTYSANKFHFKNSEDLKLLIHAFCSIYLMSLIKIDITDADKIIKNHLFKTDYREESKRIYAIYSVLQIHYQPSNDFFNDRINHVIDYLKDDLYQ